MTDWGKRFSEVSQGRPAAFGGEVAHGLDAKGVAHGGATVINWALRVAGIFVAWVLGRKLIEELGHQRLPHSGDEERLRCEKLLERPHRE